jgi:Domain of unknown function (DUF4214)/Calpain family cysteine protease
MPSWINQISDAILRSDMAIAGGNGAVSEVAMAQLFKDLASEINPTTGLSNSQLTDLKLIAANLNNGESVSSYVNFITNALVNGDTQNATWTGGANSSSTLGNLAVGTKATVLNELIGKWFLGTDLPSIAHLSSINTNTTSYSANVNSVFGVNGPQMADVNQGRIGDCYVCAALAEVAYANPLAIQSMITSNGNDTYGVRFYVNGTPHYVTVNNQLPNGGAVFLSGPDLWASLIEKAYAQLQAGGDLTGNSSSYYGNAYATIGNGGWPWYTLEEITGASQITNLVAANGSSWTIRYLNQNLNLQSSTSGFSDAAALNLITTSLAKGNDVILSSYSNAYDTYGKQTLVSSHALSIYGYDTTTGLLELRNPWGTVKGQNWDTTFEISLSTLLAAGDIITIDNLNGSANATQVVSSYPTGGVSASSASTATTVTDTAANIISNLANLQANPNLLTISLTDSNPILSITSSILVQDANALAKIMGSYSLNITSVSTGINTAHYFDPLVNYSVNIGINTSNVQHLVADSTPLMNATLTNIQRLSFTDTMVALDTGASQTAGSAYMLYQAAFNRTPDAPGLGYWIATMDAGMNINTVAQNFINSAEFAASYGGSNPSTQTLITLLYNNVLHRSPDSGGYTYWQTQLTNNVFTKAQVLEYFAASPENVTNVSASIAHGIAYQQWVG